MVERLADGVVRLRSWRPSDAAELVQAFSDPAIRHRVPLIEIIDRADAERWIARTARLTRRRAGAFFAGEIAETIARLQQLEAARDGLLELEEAARRSERARKASRS